ncbi:MAG: pro-sigmaK processing inhibitor BofA family protein [Tissierellia bacterium]|nr:pro-sigmaK processing inhibitor BofA family protein [Tissierellia bacterium]
MPIYILGVLILVIGAYILGLSFKAILKLLINALIGGIVLILFNLLGKIFGLTIPINWITSLITGIFGIPGIIVILIYFYLL